MLESRLTQALGREVKLGDLKLSILSGSVTANDLSIADDPAYSRTPFVQAKSLAIGVELWPLITSRQLHVTGLTIDQPAIALIQSPNGEWNFSKLGGARSAAAPAAPAPDAASKAPMDLSVKLVKITGGHFSVRQDGRPYQAARARRRQPRSPRFLRRQCLPLHLRHQSRRRRRDQAGW